MCVYVLCSELCAVLILVCCIECDSLCVLCVCCMCDRHFANMSRLIHCVSQAQLTSQLTSTLHFSREWPLVTVVGSVSGL